MSNNNPNQNQLISTDLSYDSYSNFEIEYYNMDMNDFHNEVPGANYTYDNFDASNYDYSNLAQTATEESIKTILSEMVENSTGAANQYLGTSGTSSSQYIDDLAELAGNALKAVGTGAVTIIDIGMEYFEENQEHPDALH